MGLHGQQAQQRAQRGELLAARQRAHLRGQGSGSTYKCDVFEMIVTLFGQMYTTWGCNTPHPSTPIHPSHPLTHPPLLHTRPHPSTPIHTRSHTCFRLISAASTPSAEGASMKPNVRGSIALPAMALICMSGGDQIAQVKTRCDKDMYGA